MLARTLIIAGAVLLLLGLVLAFVPLPSWLGRLPGDLRIERPGWRLYFPLGTSLLLSALLSLVLYLVAKLR